MPKVNFSKSFKYAHKGHTITEYQPGEQEVDEACANAAEAAGVLAKAKPKPRNKMAMGPDNK